MKLLGISANGADGVFLMFPAKLEGRMSGVFNF